ncbi:MFS family permease [Halanaeroarchaeum sp. HSR-CO]|uniref:MFS transporter n=1 Tax=Halanaeroarchaeum sp. HSR-CO TaxID=2866382 RepID=UPI00217F0588|nr:MFS transporter [Halanaeroarchaeum sp. HSR-CO]UWG46342.1 MFS family permease [Halanaeroarchaeum sp. HSR-CO]
MNQNDRSISLFVMVSHAVVHTYELSIPILMVIWLSEFGLSTTVLGAGVAVGYGLFGLGSLPSGILVDRFGSRDLVMVGLGGMGVSFVVLSMARGIVTIVIALALWGIAASIHHPAALALISTGVEEQGTGFAYHGMAGNFGIAFGPLLTAILLLVFDWRLVTVLLAVPAGVAILYAFSASFDQTAAVDSADIDPDDGGPASFAEFVASSRSLFTLGFLLAMFIVMMNGLFYRGTLTFLPDVLTGLLPPVVEQYSLFEPGSTLAEEFKPASYLYAGLLTVGMAGQYVGGKLTDRIPTEIGLTVIFAVLAIIAVSFVPVAAAGIWALIAISATFGFFLFALQPMYQATIAIYSPPGGRGLSYGYTYLASFGIGALGAAIAGSLLSAFSVHRTFVLIGVFPVIGAALGLMLYRSGDQLVN